MLKLIDESDLDYLTYLKNTYTGQLDYVKRMEDLLSRQTKNHIQQMYEEILEENRQVLEDYKLRYNKARMGNE